MHKFPYLIICLLAFAQPFVSYARVDTATNPHDFTYEGIMYRVIDEEAKTCMVRPRFQPQGYEYDYTPEVSEKVVIPQEAYDGDNPYTVIAIGGDAFCKMTDIYSVVLPSTIESIGHWAFSDSNIESVDIPESCRYIEMFAFSYCRNLKEVILHEGLERIDDGRAFGYCTSLTSIDIPESVTYLGSGTFCECYNLKTVHLPSSLSCIEAGLFEWCTKLTSIDLPLHIEYIESGSFESCKHLRELNIPNSVKRIGECAFRNCIRLETVHIPEYLEEIGGGAFYNCPLKEINFPESLKTIYGSYEEETGIGTRDYIGTFYNNKFKAVILPDDLKIIGPYAFDYCRELEYVKLPAKLEEIPEATFFICNLKEVILPDSLKVIGEASLCGPIERIRIPDGVKSLFCPSWSALGPTLQSLEIPESLEVISTGVFSDIKTMEALYYKTSCPKVIYDPRENDYNARIFNDELYRNCILYVGEGGLETARTTYPWKNFLDIREFDFASSEEIKSDVNVSSPVEVFNLNGQKVGNGTEDLPKGIYIVRKGSETCKIQY